jgi:energy-coupling factor transporter transmembrane protein EcfT
MDSPTQNASIDKLSIRNGLLMGFISAILSVVFYIVDPLLLYTNIWIGFLLLIIIIVLLVVLGLDVRKKIGGYWSFGQAFKSLIIMAVLLVTISTAYNFILIKYIDPDLPTKANAVLLEKTTTTLNNAGVSQSKIDESTKTFNDGEFIAKMQPTLKNELIGLGGGIVLYGIIGLIIAASIKKKAPLFVTPVDEES